MADDAGAVLGGTTGDPVQPMDPMYPLVPDQGANPVAGGGYTPPPAPVAEDPNAQFSGTLPSPNIPTPTPPDNPTIERQYQEAKWHQILDRVGSIMGGADTRHTLTYPDGTVHQIDMPSSTSEKWARVVAAVLGGAAKGAAAAQGPGGMARAASAGLDYGMNIPKQIQENADAQVTAAQKRTEMNANNAMLHQNLYTTMLRNNTLKIAMDAQTSQLLNDYAAQMKASPDSKDYGPISGFDDLKKIADANSDFLHQHMNLQLKAVPIPDGKGGTSIHAIATDPGDDERMNDENAKRFFSDTDDSGKPILRTENLGAGRMKNGALRLANQSEQAQYLDRLGKWATAQKNQRDQPDKVPSSYEQAYGMAANTNDPAEKKKYSDLGDMLYQKATGLKQTIAIRNVAPNNPDSAKNWGTLLANPSTGVTLANVPVKERAGVIAAMKAAGQTISKPLTGQELNRSDLANNALLNIKKAEDILARRPDMFGPAGFFSTKFKQALEGGDPDAKDFLTAINLGNLPAVGVHGVKGRWALEDLGKLDSDMYTNPVAMQRVLNDIRDSVGEFAKQGGRQTATPAGGAPAAPAPSAGGTAPKGGGVDWSKFPVAQ